MTTLQRGLLQALLFTPLLLLGGCLLRSEGENFPQNRATLAPIDACTSDSGEQYIVLVFEPADPESLGQRAVNLYGGDIR